MSSLTLIVESQLFESSLLFNPWYSPSGILCDSMSTGGTARSNRQARGTAESVVGYRVLCGLSEATPALPADNK
jgi:hypothetical protein